MDGNPPTQPPKTTLPIGVTIAGGECSCGAGGGTICRCEANEMPYVTMD